MSRKVHKNTGLLKDGLNVCPDMPNCVVSQYKKDKGHYMEPWKYKGSRERIINLLKEAILASSQSSLEAERSNYLHFTYTIPLFKFVDDVEFYLPEDKNLIHFRSASRVGYYDLGANSRRLKRIKKRLKKKGLHLL